MIGQHFPYTPIANPRYMVPEWSFGIRPDVIQKMLMRHALTVPRWLCCCRIMALMLIKKLATVVSGIDVILTGHT